MSYFHTPARGLIIKHRKCIYFLHCDCKQALSRLCQVHRVLRSGIAAQEGSIRVGDQVLSINGTALHNSTHKEALNTMRKARGRPMAVVVIRRGDVTETCYSTKDSPQKAAANPGVLQYIQYIFK